MIWSLLKRDALQVALPSSAVMIEHFITHAPIAMALLEQDGRVVTCNQAFKNITACDCVHANGTNTSPDTIFFDLVRDEDRQQMRQYFQHLLDAYQRGEEVEPQGLRIMLVKHFADESTNVSVSMSVLTRDDGISPAIMVSMMDMTEQNNLEMRFAHSQKMQAVGQLAGGIAHDFNNLLTAMIGFCDLLLMRHPAGDPSFADIMQIKQNANRAANLVRQLLAFSRRQTLQPKILDLTEVLAELSNLIRRLIGENIELQMKHGRDLGFVKADQGQLEQVLINLAVNARDAMKGGGTLVIQTSNVRITSPENVPVDYISPSQEEPIIEGEYVMVDVLDSGHGIPSGKMQKIFEPFFSTKEVGAGTGLGLSTVYGIIKQTGGYIYVKSEEGVGTTFRLYFPLHYEDRAARAEQHDVDNDVRGGATADLTGAATILLVEDETPVRIFAARALRNKGYEVLEADCGENALEVFAGFEGDIDVIISDVVMPGMNGPTMVDKLEKTYAERMSKTQVIFISGYAEDAFIDTYGTEREFNFLPKPFTLKQLASKIKDILQQSAA